MYIILTFFDTFPWEKGENVLGPIQKIRLTGKDVKKKKQKNKLKNYGQCETLLHEIRTSFPPSSTPFVLRQERQTWQNSFNALRRESVA